MIRYIKLAQQSNHNSMKKIFTAILLNMIVLAVFLLLFTPSENNVDYMIKSILEGAFGYGDSSAHLPYVNFLFGSFLKLLQSIIPAVSWYEVISYLVMFVAFTIVSYVIFDFNHLKRSFLILLSILIFWGFEGYIKLTYYKTAGISVACGLFLLISGLSGDEYKKSYLISGSALTIVGSLLCYQSLFIVLPAMAGIILVNVLIRIRKDNNHALKVILRYIIPLVILIAVIVVLTVAGSLLFNRNPEWKEYNDNKQLYSDIRNGKLISYDDDTEAYEELGIDLEDYRLLVRGDYADPEFFDPEMLTSLEELKAKPSIYNVADFFRTYPISLVKLNVIYGVVLLFLLLCFSKQKVFKWLMICYPLIIVLCQEYVIYCFGDNDIHHLDVVEWLAVALFMTYYIYNKDFDPALYSSIGVAAIVALVISINQNINYITAKTYNESGVKISREQAEELLVQLADYEDTLFVVSEGVYVEYIQSYGLFRAIPKDSMNNIFVLSSHVYPSHREPLNRFGYSNIFPNLCNDDVYYMSFGDKELSVIKDYVCEHYNEDVNYSQVDSINNTRIFKCYDSSFFTPGEIIINAWNHFEKNPNGPLDLMLLIEERGELHSAIITPDAYENKDGLSCVGRLDRVYYSGVEISKYLYETDFDGCKISIDDISPYGYLIFQGKKVVDHGQPGIYIYDQEGKCIYEKQWNYKLIDDEWNEYIIDISDLSGPVDIIINGGYIDSTGDPNSEFIFSDMFLY